MKKLILLVILAAVLIAGCASAPVAPGIVGATTGNLVMEITDAPANITSLMVTISEIEVHKSETTPMTPSGCIGECQMLGYGTGECKEGVLNETICGEDELEIENVTECLDMILECSDNETECASNTTYTCCCSNNVAAPEEETGWITFSEEEKTFDLIALRDVQEILGNATLEAGKYTQIRLLVKSAVLTVDGEEKDIKVPSGKLKLIHPFDIVANQTTTLLLDFDAEKSVVERGKTSKYNLKPTIKITTE